MNDGIADQLKFFMAINETRKGLLEGGNPAAVFAKMADLIRSRFKGDGAGILLFGEDEETPPLLGCSGLAQEIGETLCREAACFPKPGTVLGSPWKNSLGLGVASKRLGVFGSIFVGREGQSFSSRDHEDFSLVGDQIESVFLEAKNLCQLSQRNQELESIFRIDQIRDEVEDFDEMLQQILGEICRIISSSASFILLHQPEKEDEFELRATTTHFLSTDPRYLKMIKGYSREAMLTQSLVKRNNLGSPVNSIIALPLILNGKVIGVLGAINSSHCTGFDESNVRILKAITSQLDTAVFERMERRRMRQVLSRSVDPKILDALLDRTDDSLFAGERVVLSILFADIRGSTEWAEQVHPEEFVSSLNTYLEKMTEIIFKHGGTLDKFVGDEIIALFGSPVPMEDHALHASCAAIEMQKAHRQLQGQFRKERKELPPIGVGISSGEVIAGEFGPPNRTDFTAMGRVTNRGSRLCSTAKGHQIIICETTRDLLSGRAPTVELSKVKLKGISEPVPIFELVGDHKMGPPA